MASGVVDSPAIDVVMVDHDLHAGYAAAVEPVHCECGAWHVGLVARVRDSAE